MSVRSPESQDYERLAYIRIAVLPGRGYTRSMIRAFAGRDAETLFHGRFVRKLPRDIQRAAQRKLRQIHQAEVLTDLAASPGNRLEALRGDRAGQHSIRINDQWRICFVWRDGGAEQVEIVDYH